MCFSITMVSSVETNVKTKIFIYHICFTFLWFLIFHILSWPLTFLCWFPWSFGVFVGFFLLVCIVFILCLLRHKPFYIGYVLTLPVKLWWEGIFLLLDSYVDDVNNPWLESLWDVEILLVEGHHRDTRMDENLTWLLTATVHESPCLARPVSCPLFKTNVHCRTRNRQDGPLNPVFLLSMWPHWICFSYHHRLFL